jgi:hypothetical protein
MSRLSLLPLLLVLGAPAFAKPHPIPCDDLWSAVSETLGNQGNYTILVSAESQRKASFIVVGSLYPAVGVVSLKPEQDGCELEIRIGFTGNDDGYTLRSRVNRALSKRRAAKVVKASPPAPTSGAGG